MQFIYKARTPEGKLQTGTVEASDYSRALEVLQGHNLIVISVEEKKEGLLQKEIQIFRGVKARELVIFSRALSSLFDAGVPLVEGLRALAEQTPSPTFAKVLYKVADEVDGGMPFSRALGKHPKFFSKFYVSMIKTGEVSGNLQETLSFLADYTERDYVLKSKVRGALTYPAFVISVFFVVGLVVLTWVIPRLTRVLQEIAPGGELPAITRALISVSGFTRHYIWLILLLVIGGGGYLFWWLKTPAGRRAWHALQLKLPIFGPLFKKIYQARFAGNLSTLIRGGLPIIESINITQEVIGNTIYEEILAELASAVKTGKSIASVIAKKEEFSPVTTLMVAVGEKAGKLEPILKKIALFYEAEVGHTVDNLASLLEPVLIIILGVGVGLVVASVIIPMYTVITSVGG